MVIGSVDLPMPRIADLCRTYKVRELAIFGSALTHDFRDESDVDFLVEYQPDARVSLFEHIGLQQDLQDLLSRPVDLVTKRSLKQLIRQHILESSRVIYTT